MAITWGPEVADSSNAFRIGYEYSQSPVSIGSGTSSAIVTEKIYLGTKYYAWDSSVSWSITGSITASGTISFNHTSSAAWSSSNVTLLATKTRTVTTSYTSTVTTTTTASVTGLSAVAGTARVTGTWTTAKRPLSSPAAPTGLSLLRVSDTTTKLSWSNTNPTSSSAPYQNVQILRYDYRNAGVGYQLISTQGVVTTYSPAGQIVDNQYKFAIRATNSAGQSAYIYSDDIKTTPEAPINVGASASGMNIAVSWSNKAGYGTGHEIWRLANGVREGSPIASVSQSTTTWTDVAPTPSINYSYQIRSKADTLFSAYSATSSAVRISNDPPVAPTSVTPTGTVTKPNPTLGGTLVAIATGQTQRMQWQFAKDTGFTSSVQTVTEGSGDNRVSGATTETPNISDLLLTNGTWYMRARAVDLGGIFGPYAATITLTVSTPLPPTPTAVLPTGTVTTLTPTFGATVAADSAGRWLGIEWTIAKNNTFTTSPVTLITRPGQFALSGAITETFYSGEKVGTNGIIYVRARSYGVSDDMKSNWSTTVSYTLAMVAPPVPTLLTPVNASTVQTNTPNLGLTLSEATEGRLVRAGWQFATDAGFTANVRTITEDASLLRTSGPTVTALPITEKLFTGSWFFRGREIDEYGQSSAWTGAQTLIVSHKPSAVPTGPNGDVTFQYMTNTVFNWSFIDTSPDDSQSAYQIVVQRTTGEAVLDTGKVVSTVLNRSVLSSTLLKDVKLRWQIRVWDQDDVVSNYSAFQLFKLSDLPVVTITLPTAGQQVTTGKPTVIWTIPAPKVQVSFRAVFKRTSDNVVIHDSGLIATAIKTYTVPQTILKNGVAYSVTITVNDADLMSASKTHNFTTLYESPAEVTFYVDGSGYESVGFIDINWSMMQPDGFFTQWTVYRRETGDSDWHILAVYTDPAITVYHDWLANTGTSWEYAVTQTAGRSGELLESVQEPAPESILADGTHYWLIDSNNEGRNFKLDNVSSDDFTDPYEEEELIIIGRGRKVNQGTRIGYDGSISAKLRDDNNETARSKRTRLQALKNSRTAFILRTPFGDLFNVAVSNIAVSRVAGVGTDEAVDITIPYKEVF